MISLTPGRGEDSRRQSFGADSTYHSLEVEFRRRFTTGITFSAAYTLSRNRTTVSDDNTYTDLQNAAKYDFLGGRWFARMAADGWTLSGYTSSRAGARPNSA